ncbi:type III-B CRISPR module-associated protein Cmr3 [Halorhodospira abdelmalekii]|uniref:type III-B CRISPR module-associated protein Cmr3 n=1 Tax=Halorhodospira abdelmalekii TaxID=421629 RepID=UPI001907A74F|nr:type III-B CRISPR module-associated protein Cmr3 [Halorhodospira abdelmalekii]MBK1735773.1 type III-B CRISPR module-associated protein Cmr3 [Halorhodospira abdelmalekii]
MAEHRFIEPQDVLFFRSNRLFGEPGDAGSSLMPPWPSVFAGALRSAMLMAAGIAPERVAAGTLPHPFDQIIGTAQAPGSFVLTGATLARGTSADQIEPLYILPADLCVEREETTDTLAVQRLEPQPLPAGIVGSQPLPNLLALRHTTRRKPETGYWLTRTGWEQYCRGELPSPESLVHSSQLWTSDPRLGIALDPKQRTAADSQLYTTEGISMRPGCGFWVTVDGVDRAALPAQMTLRLGGDGRGAWMHPVDSPPETKTAIAEHDTFRLILTSPGLFPGGWALPGLDANGVWHYPGGRAQLLAAAVTRSQTVSGWDLAHRRPKPAENVASTGTVYWLKNLEGGQEPLGKLANTGLWGLTPDNHDPQRRAEGFNRFVIANV